MTEKITSTGKTRVFISYAHEEKEFVRKFHASLTKADMDVWVDWQDIPPAADWRAEVKRAIEGADAFLFLLSPGSISSKVCGEELEWAMGNHKKLIPVVIVPLESGAVMDKRLRVPNWVYMRPTDDYNAAFHDLVEAISTDLGWVQQHTRILQRALEWDAKKRNSSYLLQGSDIEDSEHWLGASAMTVTHSVTPLQVEFIHASRRSAVRRQRYIMIGIGIALLVSMVLGAVAVGQKNIAVKNEIRANDNAATAQASDHARATQQAIAEQEKANAVQQKTIAEQQRTIAQQNEAAAKAQRSVANAQIYQSRGGELDVSTLLAVDAWDRAQASQASGVQTQAENILRHNISFLSIPLTQAKQGDSIWTIGDSADHSMFATASQDGSACVWDASTGAKKYCVDHGEAVYAAYFGVDDQYLFTGGENGKVIVWNASDGTQFKTFDYGVPVWDLAISPNDQWLAVGLKNGVTNIYMLNNLERSPFRVIMSSGVLTTAFSHDSKWLGIGTETGEVRYWNLDEKYYTVGPAHKNAVFHITFSPDDQLAVSSGAVSTARLAVLVTGTQKYLMQHGDWVEDSAFSPDGKWFVTASDDNSVRMWDVSTGKEIRRMGHTDFAQMVTVSADGHWIASAGKDNTVRVWEAATGAQVMEIPLQARGGVLEFSADGKTLITTDGSGNITLWDVSSLSARVGYLEFPEYVRRAIFSQDGKSLFANTDDMNTWKVGVDQSLSVHAGNKGTPVLVASDLTVSMTVSKNSQWVAVAIPNSNDVLLQSLTDPKPEAVKIKPGDGLHEIAFSPDSRWLVTTGGEQGIVMWDVQATWDGTEPSQVFSLKADSSVYAVAFSLDGKWLAAGGSDQTTIWDLSRREPLQPILNQAGSIVSVSFSQDGKRLATGSANGSVYVWDLNADKSQPVHRFDINGQAMSAEFSPNGEWLAVGSSDPFAYLFDMQKGEEAARIPHSDKVTSVDFSPDGKYLATASRKVVEVWDVASIPAIYTESLIDTACHRLTENMSEATWTSLFFTEAYQAICPNLPTGTK
jgi:WD40 repeat protein